MRSVALVLGLIGVFVSQAVWVVSYLGIYGVVHDPIQNVYGGDSDYSGGSRYSSNDLGPGATLMSVDLSYADLSYADLSGASFHPTGQHGYWDDWDPPSPSSYTDLSYSNLTGANLSNTSLFGVNMVGTILNGVNFSGALLSNSHHPPESDPCCPKPPYTVSSNLSGSYLFSADLSGIREQLVWDCGPHGSCVTWTGAKYSLNAVDNSGNPIADTIFPAAMDQAWRDAAGMVAVPEPTTARFLGLGLGGLSARRRG